MPLVDNNVPTRADQTLVRIRYFTAKHAMDYMTLLKQVPHLLRKRTPSRQEPDQVFLKQVPIEELLRLDARTLYDIGLNGHDALCLAYLAHRVGKGSFKRR